MTHTKLRSNRLDLSNSLDDVFYALWKHEDTRDKCRDVDKDGKRRTSARIRWWVDPTRADLTELSMAPLDEKYRGHPVPDEVQRRYFHGEDERPVFFGHYWQKGKPLLLRRNVCCLDYSVAAGGYLACYRFDGERQLDESKLVWVE